MPWERCGNSSFYRLPGGIRGDDSLAGFYMNPFDWTGVVVSRGETGSWDEGSMTIIRRRARFDRQALETGAAEDRLEEARPGIVDEVEAWAADLERLKASGASPRDLVAYFESAPPDSREAVLRGVLALLNGWDTIQMMALRLFTEAETRVAVEIGSQADRNLHKVVQFMSIPVKKVARAPRLEEAFETVMADYGIFEC